MKLNINRKTNTRLSKGVRRLLNDPEFSKSPLMLYAQIAIGYIQGVVMSDCPKASSMTPRFPNNFTLKLTVLWLKNFRYRFSQSTRTNVLISETSPEGESLRVTIQFLGSGPIKRNLVMGSLSFVVGQDGAHIDSMRA